MTSTAGRSYLWLFWLLAVVGLTLDLGSKYYFFTVLYAETPQEPQPWLGPYVIETEEYSGAIVGKIEVVEGVFSFTATHLKHAEIPDGPLAPLRTISGPNPPYLNHGALFGQRLGFSPTQSNRVFATVSLLAALAIMYWSTRPATRRDLALSIALGLILAGTLGNFYDRVVFGGVRDFLHWYKFVDWPVFNIADCCLVGGAGLLLLHAFFTTEEHVAETPAAAMQTSSTAEG